MLGDGEGAKLAPRDRGGHARRGPRRRPPGAVGGAVDHQRHRIWPRLHAPRRPPRSALCAESMGSASTSTAPASPMRSASLGASPADLSWRAGVDALSFGFTKNGGLCAELLILFDPALAKIVHYRRKRAGHLLSKGRYLAAADPGHARRRHLAAQRPRRQCRRRPARRRGGRRPADLSGRGQRDLREGERPRKRRRSAPRASTFTTGVPARRGSSPPGTAIPPMSTRSPRRSAPYERARRRLSRSEDPLPLPARHADLGLDLDRHQGSTRRGAAGLVGQLPLPDRRRGDDGHCPRPPAPASPSAGAGTLPAVVLGVLQFVLNYNLVYLAEQYITSGLAAVVFALLVVPNAALAWAFFGQRVTAASRRHRPWRWRGSRCCSCRRCGCPTSPTGRDPGRARLHPARRARRLGLQRHAIVEGDEGTRHRPRARLGDALRRR